LLRFFSTFRLLFFGPEFSSPSHSISSRTVHREAGICAVSDFVPPPPPPRTEQIGSSGDPPCFYCPFSDSSTCPIVAFYGIDPLSFSNQWPQFTGSYLTPIMLNDGMEQTSSPVFLLALKIFPPVDQKFAIGPPLRSSVKIYLFFSPVFPEVFISPP